MGKIKIEFETEYDRGDLVIFRKNGIIQVGVVTSYYIDDNVIWYDIAIRKNFVYNYCNGGDIAEFDIIAKVKCEETIKEIKRMIENCEV